VHEFAQLGAGVDAPERSRGRSQRRDLHPPPAAGMPWRAPGATLSLSARLAAAMRSFFVVLFGLGRACRPPPFRWCWM
jgi:hypothetical protein